MTIWTDGPGLVSAFVAVLALVGTFVGFLLTLRERTKADESAAAAAEDRRLAQQAAVEANESRSRAADALERANEIAEAQLPKAFVRWGDPILVSGVRNKNAVFRVPNIGNAPARNATLSPAGGFVHPMEEGPRDVYPQQSLSFTGMSTGAGAAKAKLDWIGPDDEPDSTTVHI